MNHPDFTTIYSLPLISLWAILRLAGGELVAWKAALALADLAGALWVRHLSRKSGSSGFCAFAVCWLSPLAILEGAGRGHFEALLALPILGWLWATQRRKDLHSGFFLGMVFQIKLLAAPVLLALEMLRARKIVWKTLAGFAAVQVAVVCLAPSSIPGILRSAWRFGTEFQSHDLIPYILSPFGWTVSRIGAVALLGISVWRLSRQDSTLEERASKSIFWLLACLPTFHAWYALWLLPFAALQRKVWLHAFLFSALSYEWAQWSQAGTWIEVAWVRWAIWLPPLMAYLVEETSLREWTGSISHADK
ncbi:MAG: DUF2029 domain-containing protein [Fibrobacteres bacterium]|nr:DUF2029 domain-containing protein [Fibrobacterota bacterium]